MDAAREQSDPHLLDGWMMRRRRRLPRVDLGPGLRFAFYGRTSTGGHQDRASSHGWQREAADSLVAGHGAVVVEFFDPGCSRRLPWSARPEAAALLAELHSPQRRFEAVVIGEYERAFSGDQLIRVSALLDGLGVQVWLPEAVDRCVWRIPCIERWSRCWARSRSGRSSGRGTACWRQCARRCWSRAAIWVGDHRELTERGVPCPSDADPERNRHRTGGRWQLRTVAVILGNPHYTGRQVWDRQRTERNGDDTSQRSTPAREWAVSATAAHPALVTEAQFVPHSRYGPSDPPATV